MKGRKLRTSYGGREKRKKRKKKKKEERKEGEEWLLSFGACTSLSIADGPKRVPTGLACARSYHQHTYIRR